MERFDNVFVSGAEKYINDLQYIAKDDTKSLSNIFDLYVLMYLSRWSVTFDEGCELVDKLDKLKNCLINRDTILSHYLKDQNTNKNEIFNTGTNKAYKHVNVFQTYENSGRMYDEQNVK